MTGVLWPDPPEAVHAASRGRSAGPSTFIAAKRINASDDKLHKSHQARGRSAVMGGIRPGPEILDSRESRLSAPFTGRRRG